MELKGKTKKGRERLKRDGTDGWKIMETADTVLFSTERGPWLLISKREDSMGPESRWIHETRDPDFEIVNRNPER